MSDLIRRQDAIEAIEEITWYHQNRNREMVSGANSTEDQAWYKSQDIYAALEALPSAEAIHKPDYSYEAGMVRRLKEALSAEAAIGDYPNDLISRSALMEYCSNQKSKSIDNNDIARFPSAEAVEVVRCKDCIRAMEREEYIGRLWCTRHREHMDDMYYCADGVRREDGKE